MTMAPPRRFVMKDCLFFRSPAWVRPSLGADVLRANDRHAEALEAYETVLKKEPNRLRAMAGAATAAEGSGDPVRAAEYRQRIAEMTTQGEVA